MRLPGPEAVPGAASDGRAIVLAVIAGAHGVAGEVKLKLFGEGVAGLRNHRSFSTQSIQITMVSVREAGNGAIARFAEITTREAAEAARGTTLSVGRASLPPLPAGEVYVADLIGIDACVGRARIGRVVAVENYGAGDLVEVERAAGERFLVPFARCELIDGALAVDAAFIA